MTVYVDKKKTRITTLTKTIMLYDDYELYINNLQRLKTETFNRIKIPKFSFKLDDGELIIESEYIKGLFIDYSHSDIIYNDLVLKEGDYSFHDYNFTNFKINKFDNQIYAIDLDDFQKVDFRRRRENWIKNYVTPKS
tara:strand:- start:94 stop:504 length:411 start_codon:yes stop_codon:yes gene_type:complete